MYKRILIIKLLTVTSLATGQIKVDSSRNNYKSTLTEKPPSKTSQNTGLFQSFGGGMNTLFSNGGTSNGFDLRHQADGKLILSTPVEANIFTTTLSYKDDVKRKFKLTFISGAVSLYVDNVLTNTGTTSILDFDVSKSGVQLFIFATPGHHYDDLIIHRN